MTYRIPFCRPTLPPWEAVEPMLRKIHDTGIMTMGPLVRELEEKAAEVCGVPYVVACSNATTGLMLLVSTLKANPVVAIPGFTFSATYQAVEWNGGTARWVDCCDYDCNMDHEALMAAMAQKPTPDAILAVHISGNPCMCTALESVAASHGKPLFFDGAHALGSEYRGKKIAEWGDATVFSLGVTKIIAAGEGGLIATRDKALSDRMRLAVNHGHGFGELDEHCKGFNARLQEYCAAYALAALPLLPGFVARRNAIRNRYWGNLARIRTIIFPQEQHASVVPWKDVSIVLDEHAPMTALQLQGALEAKGIQTKRYYWPPCHRLSIIAEPVEHLRNTDRLSDNVLALPCYTTMTDSDVDYVCEAVSDAFRRCDSQA